MATLTNNGTAKVLLRPSDVTIEVFVNGAPATGAITSKTPLDSRSYVSPARSKSYAFPWDHGGGLAVGDVVRVVSCAAVRGDLTPADNCAEQGYTVTR